MHCLVLLKESVRSGTIASLAMMPFGFLFKLLDLRVGYYGPKLAALVFDEPTRFVLFADPMDCPRFRGHHLKLIPSAVRTAQG